MQKPAQKIYQAFYSGLTVKIQSPHKRQPSQDRCSFELAGFEFDKATRQWIFNGDKYFAAAKVMSLATYPHLKIEISDGLKFIYEEGQRTKFQREMCNRNIQNPYGYS
jgi:hypothetical protein